MTVKDDKVEDGTKETAIAHIKDIVKTALSMDRGSEMRLAWKRNTLLIETVALFRRLAWKRNNRY